VSDVDREQRERLARRLQAVYIAEMSGKGSVDKLYRQLEKHRVDPGWLNMADQMLEVFHSLYIVQTSTDRVRRRAQIIEFEKFDPQDL